MKKDKPRLIAGKTRIKDNDPRGGKRRGIGMIVKTYPNGRAKVEWSGTGRLTEIKLDRIDDTKHGYSFVED